MNIEQWNNNTIIKLEWESQENVGSNERGIHQDMELTIIRMSAVHRLFMIRDTDTLSVKAFDDAKTGL